MFSYKVPHKDANHVEIKNFIEGTLGLRTFDLSAAGNGIPDLMVLVGVFFIVLEIKVPGGQLTEKEARFFSETVGAPRFVVESKEEAARAISGFIDYMIPMVGPSFAKILGQIRPGLEV